MKKFLNSATLFCGFVSPSFAADAISTLPPAGFVWTGGYVGLQAGYGWGDSHLLVTGNGNYADPDPDGFVGGIYGGYNYQLANNFVLGTDIDLNYSNVKGNGDGYFPSGVLFGGVTVNGDLKWSGSARVRAGYAMDRLLPYIAGGVAFGRYEVRADDHGLVTADQRTMIGWTFGAGVDYAFTDKLVGRLEYRYTDYGHKTFADVYDVDLKTSELRIGLAYKF
jgi:outer membrane immunogenic protein